MYILRLRFTIIRSRIRLFVFATGIGFEFDCCHFRMTLLNLNSVTKNYFNCFLFRKYEVVLEFGCSEWRNIQPLSGDV